MLEATTSPWHGTLELVFAKKGNATQPIHSQSQAPLKLQRPFYPEGADVCHSIILHTAGGMVGGDRLSLSVQLQPKSQALLTTTAAAKVYRSNGLKAQQDIHIHVASGGWIEWLPQEMIVFEQAIYQQTMRVELEPEALWLGWDMTRFGRTARGEQFMQGNWRSHTEVWQNGAPLWVDRQWLPASESMFHSPHGLAGCSVIGSLALVGQTVTPELVAQARNLWTGTGEIGVTRLLCGMLCRYRGHSTLEARQWFIAVWQLLRSTYLHRPVCIPRVWQLGQNC